MRTAMKYVYLIQRDWSTTDFGEIQTELYEKYKDAVLRFHEIILNEKNPALSEIGKTAFDEDGFIKRNYELSFRYSKRKEHDQYWHLVDKNDYYRHSFIDLKRVEIR